MKFKIRHGREIPDPEYANCSPNWWTVFAYETVEWDEPDEKSAFLRMQETRDHAFHSTCNGRVPSFEFEDAALAKRYAEFCEKNPYRPPIDYTHTF